MKTKIHPALSLFALIGFVSTTVPVHAGTNVNVNLGIPVPDYRMPVDYRTVYVHEKHIPYGQWKMSHGEHGRHGDQHGHHDD